MKKILIGLICVLTLCGCSIRLPEQTVSDIQSETLSSETTSSEVSEVESKTESVASYEESTSSMQSQEDAVSEAEITQECITLKILDDINGKVIFDDEVVISEDNLYAQTISVLKANNIPYKVDLTKYFISIDGLSARENGEMSGWVFYIIRNGETEEVKSSVGSKSVKLNVGDTFIWRYKENGLI